MPRIRSIQKNNESQTLRSPSSETVEISLPIHEIISSKPGLFLRQGTTIILAVVILVFAAMAFVDYPDIVQGRMVITSNPLPTKLILPQEGRLKRVFTEDRALVRTGEPILELENSNGKYLFYTPNDGTIYFTSLMQINELIQPNENIGIIMPDTYKHIAYVNISEEEIGKITAGQKVYATLDRLSTYEDEPMVGKISKVTVLPKHENGMDIYRASISFPDSTLDQISQKAFWGPENRGQAKIIVKNKNLLSKLLAGLNMF